MESQKTTDRIVLIAHMGDIHLRDSQYANTSRSLDFFEAFRRAITAADVACVDLIVCPGDIFDNARPTPKVVGQLVEIDQLLKSMKMPMLCVTGNHDRSTPTWISTLFQANAEWGIIPLDDRVMQFEGFTFAGIQPHTAAQFRNARGEIDAMCADADVVLYHGFVDGVVPMYCSDTSVLNIKEMPRAASVKAVLLADIHVQGYTVIAGHGGQDVLVGYPGSLEMCSASESTEKSLPIIALSKHRAVLHKTIPLTIRPFITAKIRTPEQLDKLIADVREVADHDPVVTIEFDRALTETITRLHSVLNPQRAIIRCYPLPTDKEEYERDPHLIDHSNAALAAAEKTMEDFIREEFADDVELQALALAIYTGGDTDSSSLVAQFIENNTVDIA